MTQKQTITIIYDNGIDSVSTDLEYLYEHGIELDEVISEIRDFLEEIYV